MLMPGPDWLTNLPVPPMAPATAKGPGPDRHPRFRLKASNGEIIASGEAYESKASAEKGIASVQKNAADAKVVDLTE